MQTDFTLFGDRLAEACRARNMTAEELCRVIGFGGRRAVELHFLGLKAIDVYSLAQIADALEVSTDWLLGRSDVMEVPAANAKRRA